MKMKIKILIALLSGLITTSVSAYDSLSDSGFYDLQKKSGGHFGIYFLRRAIFSEYSPQYPLWSDGADKNRWIYLPRRKKIDTSNPNRWVFPRGTKLWKEFSFIEMGKKRKIETRLLEKISDKDWIAETYVWNEEQTVATLAPEEGIKEHYLLANGKYYDIPSKHDCSYCHSKGGIDSGLKKTPVLGFSALQLSDDRDPNAIHGSELKPGMITLSALQRLKKTTKILQVMPRIQNVASAPLQRSVFGYLHANCGHCHNEAGFAELTTTLNFNHDATANYIQQNGTYKTAIGKSISDYLTSTGSPEKVINPGAAENSALIYRMTEEQEEYTFEIPSWHHSAGFSLTAGVKMPFVGTNVVDSEAVDIIKKYINNLSGD